ncbi:glycosyltransferase [Nocardioides sp. zg-536]|uniref:Glycosyltransferase n=1 Tax=Nocardioides faecalis TaxID=2803858 RepID=A0A938Y966_9ACTN|nr:glycosyltransferase [Nocardioides faecalis]MBS4753691.1 glycosyltransferase [Nocardioides faecalis]QVI60685.1 glycosyltransferase [Nocardioides faecalis]
MPSGHVYVRHLAPESGPGPRRLPDPAPDATERPAGAAWAPAGMLRPEWAAEADFDIFHLHFGFDACSPEQLAELVDVLRARRKPLVYTVHDLRNPHHADDSTHTAQLDVLVPAADALLTLTPGAAAEIRRRWGREAEVVPHPHVVGFDRMLRAANERTQRADGPFRVGLHVESLRASMDPMRILPTLVDTVRAMPGAVLQVNGHRDVLDYDGARPDTELADYLRAAARAGLLELAVHDVLPEDALWSYLTSLDVSVLPDRFGTHSSWLEACRDLGTTVVAPTCGYHEHQGPVLTYGHDESAFDADSLARALWTAYLDRPSLGTTVPRRRAQRAEVADAHNALYASLLG